MAVAQGTRAALAGSIANPTAKKEIQDLLNVTSGGVADASFTIGAENTGTGAIIVSIQLKDESGSDVSGARAVTILVLKDSAGAAFSLTSDEDYTITAGTDGTLVQLVADSVIMAVSESDGDIDISLVNSGAATCYLAVVLPGGKLAVSDAITHAA